MLGLPADPEVELLSSGLLAANYLESIQHESVRLLQSRADHEAWPGFWTPPEVLDTWRMKPVYAEIFERVRMPSVFQRDVAEAPVLAAGLAVSGTYPPRTLVQDFRRLSEFEPHWFAEAYTNAFFVFFGQQLAAGGGK